MTDDQRNEILTALATAKPTKYSTLPIAFSERLAIKKMLDENAALRAGLSKAHDDIQEYGTQIDEMDAENAALRRERDAFKEVASLLLRIDVFEGKSLRENDQIATYYRIEQKDFDALNKLLQAAFAVAAPDTEAGEKS